ncbi:MAG: hypothetical protein RL033_4157 [Pseudomonadota bacterium]
MGKRETPAHARAVLVPPRPAARGSAPALLREELQQDESPSSERTQRRSKERDSSGDALSGDAFSGDALSADELKVAEPAAAAGLVVEAPVESVVEAPAEAVVEASAQSPLPPVEPRASEPAERKRSPSVPALPLVALERPSESRSDRTPSPVPRVSLVPPTGRIDPSQLAELSAFDSRNLPTIAPRMRASSIPPPTVLPLPAMTIPRLLVSRPAPTSRKRLEALAQRLAADVRASKREIALGLVIGIVLSFVLGKVGQSYLDSRDGASSLTVQSFANEPASAALPSTDPSQQRRVPVLPESVLPESAAPSTTEAALASAVPSARETQTRVLPPRAARPRAVAPRAVAPRATPARELGRLPGAAEQSERRPGVPLSPSESAGLGLELPL